MELGHLWMIAGGIIGWLLVEFVAAFTKVPMPYLLNIGALFAGGVVGYSMYFN